MQPNSNPRCHGKGRSSGGLSRRTFLKTAGAAGTLWAASSRPVMAGPFENTNEYLKIIPVDKRLDPDWVASLFARGEKETYTDPAALGHIGMPVGGLFAGTLYLGGDGRLWLWNVFNRDQEGIEPRSVRYKGQDVTTRSGANYIQPAVPDAPFAQGFAIRIGPTRRTLDQQGFARVTFDGRYPIGRVTYRDPAVPVEVTLEAFSPFIPLSLDDSSLPATVMSYRVKNTSDRAVEVELVGHLENPVCLDSRAALAGRLRNRVVRDPAFSAIVCSAESAGGEPADARRVEHQRDFGTMVLALLGREAGDRASARRDAEHPSDEATGNLEESIVGQLGRSVVLGPGEQATIDFALAWHFPNFFARGAGGRRSKPPRVGHHYGARFDSALAVGRYLAANFDRLAGTTRRWVETWYNSTLPYWLLDRTMANSGTLATTTCYRFEDGRFWAWEGIGCCPGTCTHVWHYAQAPGRLFPELERLERRRVNFGIGFHEDGSIGMRTRLDQANQAAVDGQCGRILGVLREHQTSSDDTFLRELWPKVRRAVEYLITLDGNADGILEGAQPNTLDAAWYGKISFTSSLYLAALRAAEAMAHDAGDDAFAQRCRAVAERGARNILELYNGEYFIQIEDPAHRDAIGVGPGCHIDQVFGQTWAHWVGLGRLFDRQKQLSALRALWKYNFVPDVGPFREHFTQGRWYALAGDAGLLMCTWPVGGKRDDWQRHWQYQYFNECMTGFEWQVAAHMVWEGHDQPDLLRYGLAVGRAIHDRYHATLRNPYNEIECSDHYARAMASYGVFQAVCGFNCHGPRGHLEFAPRLRPENFRAAFTAAGAWGTFAQKRRGDAQHATVTVRWGKLRLKTLSLELPQDRSVAGVSVSVAGNPVAAKHAVEARRVTVTLDAEATVEVDQSLEVLLTLS